MLRNDFDRLYATGCIQTCADVYATVEEAREKAYERFLAVMVLTKGDPCDGCPIDAKRLGISKIEVRRQRMREVNCDTRRS